MSQRSSNSPRYSLLRTNSTQKIKRDSSKNENKTTLLNQTDFFPFSKNVKPKSLQETNSLDIATKEIPPEKMKRKQEETLHENESQKNKLEEDKPQKNKKIKIEEKQSSSPSTPSDSSTATSESDDLSGNHHFIPHNINDLYDISPVDSQASTPRLSQGFLDAES